MFIGLLGGTFNPIHNGHMHIANYVYNTLTLDRVIFIPTGDPPHKLATSLAPAHHRLQMVKLATEPFEPFVVDDREALSPTVSYSIDTITDLKNTFPRETRLGFIIGLDAFLELPSWKQAPHLFELCHFIVCSRPGVTFTQLQSLEDDYPFVGPPLRNLGLAHSRACRPKTSNRGLVAAYCGVLYNSTPIISMTRTTPPKLSLSHEQAIFIAQAAKDKKAEDVLVLEVGDLTSLADFFIFGSGESERQVRGLAAFIEKSMATRYQALPVIEGKETANWILLDYGNIIVHIFRSDIRQYYALEKMWADAPQVPIPEPEHPFSPPRQLVNG
jgi:nicotinate-nucleotide adenylyltransferase